jgi:hypothetical protein
VKDAPSPEALVAYIARYKDTFYAERARQRIEVLKKQAVSPPALSAEKPARKNEAPTVSGMLRCESNPDRTACELNTNCSWADNRKQCEKESGGLATGMLEALPPVTKTQPVKPGAPAASWVLKPGMVVPRDLPPEVQRCIAAQGKKNPWEYDWAKCGVIIETEPAQQPIVSSSDAGLLQAKPALSAEAEHFVCGEPQGPEGSTFAIAKDTAGNFSEILVRVQQSTYRYRVTKVSQARYEAEDSEAKSPDSVGGLSMARLTGEVIRTNRISFAAVEILAKFCDGQLSQKACTSAMETTSGGNPFACFTNTTECEGWRNKSNVLSVFRDTCKRVARKS